MAIIQVKPKPKQKLAPITKLLASSKVVVSQANIFSVSVLCLTRTFRHHLCTDTVLGNNEWCLVTDGYP